MGRDSVSASTTPSQPAEIGRRGIGIEAPAHVDDQKRPRQRLAAGLLQPFQQAAMNIAERDRHAMKSHGRKVAPNDFERRI
jgi:hypothetical protein